jgi:hypothetical protein
LNPIFYRASFITTAGLLLLAIGEMPWGYYQTLRWLVPISGVLVIVRAMQTKLQAWVVLGALAIIFFFPMFGVYLDKTTWAWFDLAFAASFIVAAITLGKNNENNE